MSPEELSAFLDSLGFAHGVQELREAFVIGGKKEKELTLKMVT